MKLTQNWILVFLFFLCSSNLNAQSFSAEKIDFKLLKRPQVFIEPSSRTYKVTVTSPYNLTADDVIKNAKEDHKKALAEYEPTVAASVKEFQKKLAEHEAEVLKAKEKFAIESAEFKKKSLLERLSLTEQGLNPKLATPAKPEYVKPAIPAYQDPDLNLFTIVDNNVLASQIILKGFERGNAYLDISVDIKGVNFQDNAGQTFAKQPTKLIVKVNGVEKVNQAFFQEYAFLSSQPSTNLDKSGEEKNHLIRVVDTLNSYLNGLYGFEPLDKTVKILAVKNKGKYDDLERADIYVKTNLRKLQPSDSEVNTAAFSNMQKGIDIWTQTLSKVNYKDDKADFNAKIAKPLYFNLINLHVALDKRAEAEKFLNQLQENLIYIKLSYDEQNELKLIEKYIYQTTK